MVLLKCFQDVENSLTQNTTLNLPVCKENSLEIKFVKNDKLETVYSSSAPLLPFGNSDVYSSTISSWRRLSVEDEGCKAVYEVTFDVQDSNFSFTAGDTIGVIPQNDDSDVDAVITHLDLTSVADTVYILSLNNSQKAGKIPPHVPVKSSIRHVLTHCVDLRSVLKKLFLLALSKHTEDENERRILEYVCSKEGTKAYQSHILNRNLCLLDLFATLKTCKPPIQVLLANLPRLLPRPYSTVNSGLKEANVLKICFSVMPLQNNRKGLTTGWLEKIILNQECNFEKRMSNLKITNDCDILDKVPIYLRKNFSGFSLPKNVDAPLILIGPGTGVAPFIGFLEERELYKNNNPESKLGEVWIFFGCRNPELDFIYEDELNGFLARGVLTKLCTAFSRVENSDTKYIQDALQQNSIEITKLIESNASIFVCGDVKNMATQVKDKFIQCLVTSGKSVEEATKMLSDLQKEQKFIVDAWS